MSDIQNLIRLLQSNDHNKRYDACELLRVSPSLPSEALDALRIATNDENPDVVDAAQRALAFHDPQLKPDIVDEKENDKAVTNTVISTKGRDLAIGFFGWFLIGNLVAWILYFGFALVTVIATGILFYKKMNWFAYGVIAAVITNTLIMEILGSSSLSPSLGGYLVLLLFGVSFPLPTGIFALMQ